MANRSIIRCPAAFAWACLLLAAWGAPEARGATGGDGRVPDPLWDVDRMTGGPPPAAIGEPRGLVREVWYEGEPFQGRPTRVFAWLGVPADGAGRSADPGVRHPAMLLVHGGGGRAFREWAEHWAKRGYVALAMDTAGQGPDGQRHADGGPDQTDRTKFEPFADADEARDRWTYHAVAAVLRGHGLLASLDQVDPERIGITGISWGGYLTCIVAGIDHGLKVAVPVYGCGFLGDNSVWRDRSLAALSLDDRDRWIRFFDPGAHVGGVRCPILFLNGTNDFAYPLDSYRKTWRQVPAAQRTIAVHVELPHGHIWTFPEVDAFVDSVLDPGPGAPPLCRLGEIAHDGRTAWAPIEDGGAVDRAQLAFTTDTGAWPERRWTVVPAEIGDGRVSATLPDERPLTFFLSAVDARGLRTSSGHGEVGTTPENSACIPRDKLEEDFYDWHERHRAVMSLKSVLDPDIVLIGDSITHLWGGEPAEARGNRGIESWNRLFEGRRPLNLGFGWDRTQNVLWRIDHGELDGLKPEVIVVHIGTNNLAGTANARANTPAEIAEGIRAVVERAKAKCPGAKVVLMAVMPRGEKPDDPMRRQVAAINSRLPDIAKATGATLVDLAPGLLADDGTIPRERMPDFLHPAADGYAVWAEALGPHLER